MRDRLGEKQSEHDAVVSASARTYAGWANKGFKVSVNPNGQKNQFVGASESPLYPDVVIWEPHSSGSSSGKAHIIEEIETDDSVNEREAAQWSDYGSLGISTFNLVVPAGRQGDAHEIIRRKGIAGVTRVQGYHVRNGRIEFEL
jgi:hypothetical protein